MIGYNGTEPDVMYFRSQEITPQAAANESGAPEGAGGVSSGGMDTGTLLKSAFNGCFFRLFTVRYYLSNENHMTWGRSSVGRARHWQC